MMWTMKTKMSKYNHREIDKSFVLGLKADVVKQDLSEVHPRVAKAKDWKRT